MRWRTLAHLRMTITLSACAEHLWKDVRTTYAYKKRADILQAVTGTTGDILMRALQARGFAKTRGR